MTSSVFTFEEGQPCFATPRTPPTRTSSSTTRDPDRVASTASTYACSVIQCLSRSGNPLSIPLHSHESLDVTCVGKSVPECFSLGGVRRGTKQMHVEGFGWHTQASFDTPLLVPRGGYSGSGKDDSSGVLSGTRLA